MARNMEVRLISRTDNKGLAPKHVRRSLSPNAQKGPLIALAVPHDKRDDEEENHAITPHDDPGRLFKSPTFDFELPPPPQARLLVDITS
ncbi:hypothetical protein N7489_004711 [Penicillium chrysogenum]|uniref:uncharacterized protein n=1 Tax=Penicillium chrysogenum TaxID=5076 RepID=UPI0024DF0BC5|nr:uncharacterized protein N7489_004711 [Penicillium chrysogenum]KAJ5244615.1 hypothetical protein N7489_004711 [Penicillium chrysogenum]